MWSFMGFVHLGIALGSKHAQAISAAAVLIVLARGTTQALLKLGVCRRKVKPTALHGTIGSGISRKVHDWRVTDFTKPGLTNTMCVLISRRGLEFDTAGVLIFH